MIPETLRTIHRIRDRNKDQEDNADRRDRQADERWPADLPASDEDGPTRSRGRKIVEATNSIVLSKRTLGIPSFRELSL